MTRRLLIFALLGLILAGVARWTLPRSESATPPPITASPNRETVSPPLTPAATRIPADPASTPDPSPEPVPAPPLDVASSLGDLLASPASGNKALLAGLSRLALDANRPAHERQEALRHLLNLSSENPSDTLRPLLIDPRLPETLALEIVEDSFNATSSWQFDACLAVLTHRPENPLRTAAREHLAFLIGADHGDKPSDWTRAVAQAKAGRQ